MDTALSDTPISFRIHHNVSLLFPQLTMGLALLIVVLKTMALRTGNEHYNHAARFWAKIFAINFAMGVVTGIPMEFQFGTNWARFSQGRRRRHRADARHGRRLFVLPGIGVSRPVPFRREAPRPHRPYWWSRSSSFWARGCPATSSSPPTPGCSTPSPTRVGPNGDIRADQLLGAAPESVGALAVRPQHDRRRDHWPLRDGRAWARSICSNGKHAEYGRTFVRVGVIAGFIASVTAAVSRPATARAS